MGRKPRTSTPTFISSAPSVRCGSSHRLWTWPQSMTSPGRASSGSCTHRMPLTSYSRYASSKPRTLIGVAERSWLPRTITLRPFSGTLAHGCEGEVAEVHYQDVGADCFVPPADQLGVHLLDARKGTRAEVDDTGVGEVVVCRDPDRTHAAILRYPASGSWLSRVGMCRKSCGVSKSIRAPSSRLWRLARTALSARLR